MATSKYVSDETRVKIKDFLLDHMVDGQLRREALKEAADHFYVGKSCIARLWQKWTLQRAGSLNDE